MGIAEVISAPASPWQNPYSERVIGSIRRECLDHVIVLNQACLRHILTIYSRDYHWTRTHLGLEKDAPDPRRVSATTAQPNIAIPEVGGLHHRYERQASVGARPAGVSCVTSVRRGRGSYTARFAQSTGRRWSEHIQRDPNMRHARHCPGQNVSPVSVGALFANDT
jgi:integrase-like protein